MSNIADDVSVYPWYAYSIENCIETDCLMGEILWGFLYARREVARCQENQRGRVPSPAVPT